MTLTLIVIVLIFNGVCCTISLAFDEYLETISKFTLTMRYILQTSYNALFLVIFHIHVEFTAACLNNLFHPIRKTPLRKLIYRDKRNMTKETGFDVTIVDVATDWSNISTVYKVTPTKNSPNDKLIEKYDHKNENDEDRCLKELDQVNYDYIKLETLSLFDYLNLAIKYLGPFLLVVMAVLVGSLLVTLFYFSLFLQMSVGTQLQTFAHMIMTIFPLFYAANTPICFERVVSLLSRKKIFS